MTVYVVTHLYKTLQTDAVVGLAFDVRGVFASLDVAKDYCYGMHAIHPSAWENEYIHTLIHKTDNNVYKISEMTIIEWHEAE